MNNMKLPPGVMPQDKADNIPAKLSPGEYVIPAEVVRRKGTEFFDKLVDSGKKDLNQAAQQGRIGGTPQMPQQQQRPAPQMKPMQQGQPKPPQMQQMQQRGPMAQMQQRPAPMAQQGQPQRLPMANGGFVAGPQMAHAAQAGNQAYHAGPQAGNYANGGQVNYPQGYNPYQNTGPYQFYPYQLGPQAWGGYPGPHVNPNFYDYTARRNTQTKKEDEVEGKKAADLRPGETEDGKMVGTNTDYDVAIANMKNQGGMGDHDNPDTMDYGDIPAATAVDMAISGFNVGTMQDEFGLTDAQKDHVESQVNDRGIVGPNGNVPGAVDVPGTIAGTLSQMAKGFMDWSRDPSEGNAPSRSRGNAPKGVPDKEKDVSLDEFGGVGDFHGGTGQDGGSFGQNDSDVAEAAAADASEDGSGSMGGELGLANGGLVVPPAVQAFRRK